MADTVKKLDVKTRAEIFTRMIDFLESLKGIEGLQVNIGCKLDARYDKTGPIPIPDKIFTFYTITLGLKA